MTRYTINTNARAIGAKAVTQFDTAGSVSHDGLMLQPHLEQAGLAAVYYFVLIALMRMAGKRLAGQTTTFDLLVLIALGVVLQNSVLRAGPANAAVFILTVFLLHRGLAEACARSPWLRKMIRGAPRPLVKNGRVMEAALLQESLSLEELKAGLRKLGYAGPEAVKLAVLEETGHISAVPLENPNSPNTDTHP